MTLAAVFFAIASHGTDTSLSRLESGLNELVYQLSRSVVTVESYAAVSAPSDPAAGEETIERLISSGIIYDLHGHILVAAEAVDNRERILVRFEDEVLPAGVRGVDHQTGLAAIHVNRKIGVPATLVSTPGCAGQMVIAMGNSYGVRACPSLGFCAGTRPDGTVQFSASITSGTVGGGLFDLSGNLVGLITGGIGPANQPEVGLAIPAHRIPDIVRHLLIRGDRPVGYIGLTTADIEISPGIELTAPNRLAVAGPTAPEVITRGIMITAVVPGSPAALAGLAKGDLLVAMDETPLTSALDLRNQVRQTFPGTEVRLTFIRQNAIHGTRLVIGELQADVQHEYFAPPRLREAQRSVADSLRQQIEILKTRLLQMEKQLQTLSK